MELRRPPSWKRRFAEMILRFRILIVPLLLLSGYLCWTILPHGAISFLEDPQFAHWLEDSAGELGIASVNPMGKATAILVGLILFAVLRQRLSGWMGVYTMGFALLPLGIRWAEGEGVASCMFAAGLGLAVVSAFLPVALGRMVALYWLAVWGAMQVLGAPSLTSLAPAMLFCADAALLVARTAMGWKQGKNRSGALVSALERDVGGLLAGWFLCAVLTVAWTAYSAAPDLGMLLAQLGGGGLASLVLWPSLLSFVPARSSKERSLAA